MMQHKFKAGQIVEPEARGPAMAIPPGTYEVLQLMPATTGGSNQYRIKSLKDGHQRVVRESELAPDRVG